MSLDKSTTRLPLTSPEYHSIDRFQDCAISLIIHYASGKDLSKIMMVQESTMLLPGVKAAGSCNY